MAGFSYDNLENIVEKGENAGYQHFLLFPQCFQKVSYTRSLKVGNEWQNVKDKTLCAGREKKMLLKLESVENSSAV